MASSIWQVSTAARDAVVTRPAAAWTTDTGPLLDQLEARDANLGRTEVVPSRSHREAAALAPYVNLARGWNRQADAERNALFYTPGLLTPASYHALAGPLGRALRGAPARATRTWPREEEAALIEGGLRYLHAGLVGRELARSTRCARRRRWPTRRRW